MAEQPKVITREQYLALPSDEERKKWVAYTPSSDPEMVNAISMVEAEAKAAAIIKPLHDKLANLPIEDLPAEKLKEAVEKFEPLEAALKAIEALSDTPPINKLVGPLVDFINSLIEIIGYMFYLTFALARGKELFLDGVHQTITEIKWDELEDAMNEMKRKKENAKKQKEADDKNAKIKKENAKKVRKLVDKKTSEEMEKLVERVDKAYEQLKIAEASAQIQRKINERFYVNMTWENMKDLLLLGLQVTGIDLRPLDQVTPEQMKKFQEDFPDPTSQIKKMNDMINKLNKDTKYIPLEELEKIDKEAADSVKKSRAEREKEIEESTKKFNERQKNAKQREKEIEKEYNERGKLSVFAANRDADKLRKTNQV